MGAAAQLQCRSEASIYYRQRGAYRQEAKNSWLATLCARYQGCNSFQASGYTPAPQAPLVDQPGPCCVVEACGSQVPRAMATLSVLILVTGLDCHSVHTASSDLCRQDFWNRVGLLHTALTR